ncbi:MAG: hypothetical protein ABL949_04395 [Fimbriimonadaceae bacterium]
MRFSVIVQGLPPAKNEAVSMLGCTHKHRERVADLLSAVKQAVEATEFDDFGQVPLGIELTIHSVDGQVPGDATNYLGGVGDVLEVKQHRKGISHLGELATVALYVNDKQIKEVHYFLKTNPNGPYYELTIWSL